MGARPVRIRFMSQTFLIDAPACDRATYGSADDSCAFGLVRELFVRNCYLRSRTSLEAPLVNVIDGGANRGLFAVFAAVSGANVIAVEPQDHLCGLIHHHMRLNGIARYAVEPSFLGDNSLQQAADGRSILSMADLIARHNLSWIDLVKLDIEGGEFALFADTAWLKQVGALTMEIHASHGDPVDIVELLREHEFDVELRDFTLRRVEEPSSAVFISAESQTPRRPVA
jgi:FkbM family methyltransferase